MLATFNVADLDWRGDCATADLGDGATLNVRIVPDYDAGAPWENGDGLGDWSSASRSNGYWSEHSGRVSFPIVAVDAGRGNDRWHADMSEPFAEMLAYWRKNGASRSVAQDNAQADVMRRIACVRGFLNDDWSYVGAVATITRDCESCGSDHVIAQASLWGIDDAEYARSDVASDLVAEVLSQSTATQGV